MQNYNASEELSNFIFQSKYSRFIPSLNRKETFEEAVDRIDAMHTEHLINDYPNAFKNSEFANDYIECIEAYKQKKILGSQRGLQFGGMPILKNNCKLYNCSFTYVDRLEVFKQIEWVLLCGCGVGISVEKQHVDKLPCMCNELSSEVYNHVISDDIEGWSYAINAIINYYFDCGNKYPKFDYSHIRPKGSYITGGFKAPGPDGLRNSILEIEKVLNNAWKNNKYKKLTPLNCTDIIAHLADSVLSGGLRRSALIVLFDHNDSEMINCKTNNWYYTNPQRGRFNMSAALDRDVVKYDDFIKIFNATKQFGEPGFFFRSDSGVGCNPCQPAWASVLTKRGLSTIGEIQEGDEIWSESGWTKVIKKWSTGIKDVHEIRTTGGIFNGTLNHRLVSKGVKIEASDCEVVDSLAGHIVKKQEFIPEIVMDGLVLGDGSVHKASNNLVLLYIGENDTDYFNSEIKDLIVKSRPGVSPKAYEIKTNIKVSELPLTYNRSIPERYMLGDTSTKLSFLRGLYSANGSVVSNRITFKTASSKLRDDLQILLSSVGIRSYFTTNKPRATEFKNGEYTCKESYDVNISVDRNLFVDLIGFIQNYKNDKITTNEPLTKTLSYKVISNTYVSTEEVFDITVDNETHTYWTGGLNVSNCAEIGFKPIDKDGNSGFAFCNLITINGGTVESEEDFYERCKHASTIGTIQASYMDLNFLGDATINIVKDDPLIGVSIAGEMTNPDILLNPKVQQKGAQIIKDQNEKIAKALGINIASRTTCLKPDGTTSLLLGTTPGCHGEHAKHYIRRVQVNKTEDAGIAYKKHNPEAVVESIWSNNHTDDCIMFPITAKEGSIFKSELFGIKQLEVVKNIFENWIIEGMRDPYSTIQNNVSNTVTVPDDQWDDVANYIWENRNTFAGISFIPQTGDLSFNQPPYTEVLMPEELLERYGEGIIFASGLIVDTNNVFNNLWEACDCFNSVGEVISATDADIDNLLNELYNINVDDYVDRPLKDFQQAKANQYAAQYDILSHLGYSDEFIEELIDNEMKIPRSEIKKYLDSTMFPKNISEKRDIMRRFQKFSDKYFDGDDMLMIYALKHVQLFHDWCALTRNYNVIDWNNVKWKNEAISIDETGAMACNGGACEITKL